MDKINFSTPVEHTTMLNELRKIPFAKTDDGYRFASWLHDLNYGDDMRQGLMQSANGNQAAALLDAAKAELDGIVVTEEDYLAWSVHKKEAGGIARYHQIIRTLSMSILMLAVNCDPEQIQGAHHIPVGELYQISKEQYNQNVKCVLNRNNPFSDVSIKSQQFFYKTADGGTETLFFNTGNIVEKSDHNGKSLFTMRPGFSVTKEHGVVQKPMQKVTFSNTITEPVVADEDHIYIHID